MCRVYSSLTYCGVDCGTEEEGPPEVPLVQGGVGADAVREGVVQLALVLVQLLPDQVAPRVLADTHVPVSTKTYPRVI